MRYVQLGPEGPNVSRLCIGTASYGTTLSRAEAFKQLDCFCDHGGNFIDTAHVYADWIPGGRGASESTIGAWLKTAKMRDKVVITTKGGHPPMDNMSLSRLKGAELRKDLEESLARLGIDTVDLYFLHRDDPSIPVDEILDTLEQFRKEGKIKHYGCSNWQLKRIKEADSSAAKRGAAGFIANQIRWGIGDINWSAVGDKTTVAMNEEIYKYHSDSCKAVMAYTSSCKGYFSKKIKNLPVDAEMEAVYGIPSNEALVSRLRELERELHCGAAMIVSAYIMNQSFPSVPVSAYSSLSQLEEGLAACDMILPGGIAEELRKSRKFLV